VLAHSIEFAPERDAELFAAVPAAPAVFLLSGENAEPYVSKTASLRRRLIRLLGESGEISRRLNLRGRVRHIEFTLTGSDFESGFLLYQTLRQAFPAKYRERLRLRFAPLVKFNLDNPYPRAYITRRITGLRGGLRGKSAYYGPFASRAAAEKFLNDSLDLFKMRRCDFDLHPDPQFPGCIYSEMKMCLAPCFKGCSDEEYAGEVGRVKEYLDSGGQSLLREIATERERASAELKFEDAAALHARVEKAAAAAGLLPEFARRLDRLAALMVQPAAQPDAVALFRVDAGRLSGPILFPLQRREGQPQSMESRLLECLAAAPPPAPGSALELMEHLALLKHWLFRSRKTGEAFFADHKGELPLRRIVRGISRVFHGEKAPSGATPEGPETANL
jgi:excinuclease UvrABC nuclease subunit